MKRIKTTSVVFVLLIFVNLSFVNTFAQNSSENTETVYTGNDLANVGNQTRSDNTQLSTTPQITGYILSGDVDSSKTGLDFYKNISI